MSTHFMKKIRVIILVVFSLLTILSALQVSKVKFSFSFEQFFPKGDKDLEVFQNFVADFESDDNFLLLAVENKEGVFNQSFLQQFSDLCIQLRSLNYVKDVQSLTKISYPVLTPFGLPTSIPVIHIDKPALYPRDKEKILNDERFVHNLINEDATALVAFIKVKEGIQLDESKEFILSLNELITPYEFDAYHYLGRPYFQKELVEMQKREIIVSAVVSSILVTIIMFFIFRQPIGITVALVSIGLGMLYFVGFMGATGREMNAMAALYPVLMIIVGTSDVIHIMTKYIDELRKGKSKPDAVMVTVKEIGLATLLTSITTAIGFASLLTSKIGPIKDFGINAAIGVLIAYITVVFLTTALLSFFNVEQLIKIKPGGNFWDRAMTWSYRFTAANHRKIALGGLATILICVLGISLISTNYSIIRNMPNGKKITSDFKFFEEKLTGFRPVEFAVYAQGDYKTSDFEFIQQIDALEQYLHQFQELKAIGSVTTLYKSINQMVNRNASSAYKIPSDSTQFKKLKKWVNRIPDNNVNVLVSKDEKKARVTSRIMDVGADSINAIGENIDRWIADNTDQSIAVINRTGTGFILDKNSEYVRQNLLQGLGMAIVIVSILMVFLFRNARLLIISLIPNLIPLLVAGALLGFLGIELEAGVSIVFAVIFGIAVDDTIHFLSKYKLSRNKGYTMEESLKITFEETGKAICLTTIILFFGFLVMLFSIHPPSVVVGTLISVTLFSALFSDLLFIPILMRALLKE